MNNLPIKRFKRISWLLLLTGMFWLVVGFGMSAGAVAAQAAELRLTPQSGVYEPGATFTARIQLVTGGAAINAAEGTLRFNPNELSVVGINRSSSIFNLWVSEPSFNNSAGTVSFSGGVPTGYTGSTGTVLSVTFRTKTAGTQRVEFTNGAVLANDGLGTNVLTAMNGGSFTVQAVSVSPEPERIVEYVPPVNTPARPSVTSVTHPDAEGWYATTSAEFEWALPNDVTAVRTLLSDAPTAIPTRVYEPPISRLSLIELDQGVQYLHVQFRNADGWGRVAHHRVAIDTVAPTDVSVLLLDGEDMGSAAQTLLVQANDGGSGIAQYQVRFNNNDPLILAAAEVASGTITLPPLPPGDQTVMVTVADQAGNLASDTITFTIESFDKPVFTALPDRISSDVVPVLYGSTRPGSVVDVFLERIGGEPNVYQVTADENGTFAFIPDGALMNGVYELSALATDPLQSVSELSDIYRVVVEPPGYLRIGGWLVSVLSVIVPLIVLSGFVLFLFVFLYVRMRRYRQTVAIEAGEADVAATDAFNELRSVLRHGEEQLRATRKTKSLTKGEQALITSITNTINKHDNIVHDEIDDITNP
jgi:hypothetical protein